MSDEITRRACALLQAIEREVDHRRRSLPVEPSPLAERPLRPDATLLAALELGVAGHSREDVEHRLRAEHGAEDAARLVDAVFGEGTAPEARLQRG